ncbi:hypothetical protein PFFCH_01452 [Plasmodium falciparum FCH/4]|uniref:Protein transport protein SEC23 n=1 Tax=Plasmodium falciparum FCH/4 TaxID=1036724 RepID=A0A024VRL0_PLAFA|nr:hypothetical protein PFFCH_01452 [Plasmodium falciparum FCH/4]
MDIHAQENQTGIRFSWNLWPPTKAEAAKIEVPLGCLYTVLKRTDDSSVKLVEYEPLKCKTNMDMSFLKYQESISFTLCRAYIREGKA